MEPETENMVEEAEATEEYKKETELNAMLKNMSIEDGDGGAPPDDSVKPLDITNITMPTFDDEAEANLILQLDGNGNGSWVGVETVPNLSKEIEQLEELVEVQCADGNWNYDPYMHGMANGMILALAMMKGIEPAYLEAPQEWLADTTKRNNINKQYDEAMKIVK